jgi:hypothetical protein
MTQRRENRVPSLEKILPSAEVVKRLGTKKGSKLSAYVQKYGKGIYLL